MDEATTTLTKTDDRPTIQRVAPATIPYVSTTLHTIWLPAVVPTPGYIWATTGDKPDAKPMPHFELTLAVYAWMRQRLSVAEDRAWDSQDADAMDAVRVAAARWFPVADWAEAVWSDEERRAAVPRLPEAKDKVPGVMNW